MKTSIKAGLFFSLIWVIIVLIIFLMDRSIDLFLTVELLSLLTLLGAIFTGLFLTKKENNYEVNPALDDFKIAMQSGLIYTILVSGFIYVYHNKIDPSIQESFVQQRIESIKEFHPDEASFKELQKTDPTWKTFSYDDYIENQVDQTRAFIGPFFTSLFHLMIFFMFSLFYSFFVTIVLRKVILRQ